MEEIENLELENRMMRERNERLEEEVEELRVELKGAIRAYRELLLKYDSMEERTQR